MKIKVVYNACFGGFGLSHTAVEWMAARGHAEAVEVVREHAHELIDTTFYLEETPRHHALLVMAVEELGSAASGAYASLRVKELRGRRYRIEEYDGQESVVEPDDLSWIEV